MKRALFLAVIANGVQVDLTEKYIFDGDSLTVGNHSTSGHDYPTVMMQSHTGIEWVNYAVGGQGIDDILADAATQIDPTYPNNPLATVMCWIGANNQGGVAATTLASIISYHTLRRAAGHATKAFTILPRGDGDVAAHEANRILINAGLRAQYADIIDVAADGRLQDCLDETVFYTDHIHLIDAGYAIIAALANGATPQTQNNLVVNPGMEIGAGDLFTNWTLSPGSGGSITSETTVFNSGARAAKLTRGSAACFMHQIVNVIPNRKYRLSVYSAGDGTHNGSLKALENGGAYRNVTGTITALGGVGYAKATVDFYIPADCAGSAIDIQLSSPGTSGQYMYFDDASLTFVN